MELLVMHNLKQAINELKIRFDGNLICIETGTIRSYTEKHESTRHISEALGARGRLISIDKNLKSIQISKDICKDCSNITWVHLNSLNYLMNQKDNFHFAFLDSVNDRNYIFEEFKLIVPRMISGGIIIVDDAGVTFDGKENLKTPQEKGRKISEFLLSSGHKNFVRNSLHGTQLWINIKDLVLEKKKE